jgi:protein O-mannosyl-transferase
MIRRATIPLGIAGLTVVSFLPALSGAFLNWDDNVNFLDNPAYRGLGREQIRWAFTSVLFGHYIPLTRLTWSLNFALGGLDPWGYHLVNVLVHAANAAIFYFVARRLLAAAATGGAQDGRRQTEIRAGAAVAAIVFGIHPLRVEPVTWITGRADLLCALFALLAAWAYLRSVEAGGPARPGLVALSALAFAAALLSKGAALPLPAALFLLDVYPLRRLGRYGWWALVREKVSLLLVGLAGAGVVMYALRYGAVLTETSTYGPLARVCAAGYSFTLSLVRFIWPAYLSPLYEMPARITPAVPRFGLAVAAAVVITIVLTALRTRWPGGLAAWTFSALMLAPTSLAVRQGVDLAPDRYSYLAGLGFAVLVGGGVLGTVRLVQRGVLTRPIARMAGVAGVAALMGLGAASWSFAQVWAQSESLWRWAVEVDPTCSVCQGKLGESVLGGRDGTARIAEAEALFRLAIALRPDLPDAYFNLGTALALQHRYAEAEEPLRRYMERVPGAATGPERLGLVYLLQGRHHDAIPLLRSAFVRKPDSAELRGSLIQALEGRARELETQGRGGEAREFLAEARALGSGGAVGPAGPDAMAPRIAPGAGIRVRP